MTHPTAPHMTALDLIINDLTGRSGLRQEWDNIDLDIQEEIKETWDSYIQTYAEQCVMEKSGPWRRNLREFYEKKIDEWNALLPPGYRITEMLEMKTPLMEQQ